MAYKVDIRVVVKDHLKTLVNDGTNQPDFRDWFFFLILPIIISVILIYLKVYIACSFIGSIISGLAIYVGLLFNLILLMFEIINKGRSSDFKLSFAKELVANISFSILLSIATIIAVLFTLLDGTLLLKTITNGIAYFFLLEMIIHIILLVKRMYYQLIEQSEKTDD